MTAPTVKQRQAAFAAAQRAIDAIVERMIGQWAEAQITHDEVQSVSDAVAIAVVNAAPAPPAPPPAPPAKGQPEPLT